MAVVAQPARARGGIWVGKAARFATTSYALLPVTLAATIACQAITAGYYFYDDDYVPFGEIVTSGRWQYVHDLLFSQDLTPNWRVLPGLLYIANYEAFGMEPLAIRVTMLGLHAGTAALLFRIVRRTGGPPWAAALSLVAFGLHPTYAGALGQVTTATLILGGFFLAATALAAVECALAARRRDAYLWLGAGIGLYLATIASHEGMAIMFPVIGLVLLSYDPELAERPARALIRAALRTAPFAAIGLATAAAFAACACNEASRVWSSEFAVDQSFTYLGRLLYPVGLDPAPGHVLDEHRIAAIALVALFVAIAAVGPPVGRVGVLWALLATLPHVFISYAAASRYTYLATPGFALAAAAGAIVLVRQAEHVERRLPVLLGVPLAVAVGAWYTHQTIEQNRHFDEQTTIWRSLHADVTRVFPQVAPEGRVEIICGPFWDYRYQPFVLPAFAQTTWGPSVTMATYACDSPQATAARASGNPYVAEYRDGALVSVRQEHQEGADAE